MSWRSTKSKILGAIQGRYFMDYGGIRFPFPKQYLISGSTVDERVKGGKKTEFLEDHLPQFFRPGDTVLDIGAHIGTHAIQLALLGGLVHAFEASPRNVPRLRALCKPLRQIQVHDVGVSNRAGAVQTRFPDCIGPDCPEQLVTYVVYDEYAQEMGIPDPAFVKIDIEGMETVAFFGMTNLLEVVPPIWHLKYHPECLQRGRDCPGFLPPEKGGFDFDALHELGYIIIRHKTGFERVETMVHQEPYYLIPEEKMKALTL